MNLRRIIIPTKITAIGENAFFGCSELTAMDLTGCSKSEKHQLITSRQALR